VEHTEAAGRSEEYLSDGQRAEKIYTSTSAGQAAKEGRNRPADHFYSISLKKL